MSGEKTKMKKSELIQKIVNIEKEKDPEQKTTISMGYIHYLEEIKKLVEVGDIDLK